MSTSTTKGHEAVVIQLGTPVAEANAAAVASTMHAVVAIVEQAQQELRLNEKLLIKARPFGEGSLEIPLELVIVGSMLLLNNQHLFERLLGFLKDYIEAKKLLQGNPPPPARPDGSVVIRDLTINHSVVNILINEKVNSAMDKAAVDIAGDETIAHVKVLTGEDRNTLATIDRGEIEYFRSSSISYGTLGEPRERTLRTKLIVHTPVLKGKGKWKFVYDRRTISVDIRDEDFMQSVEAGSESFAAGDRLDVDLFIHEEYDHRLAIYEEKRHSIVHVYGHAKRPEDLSLFDEESISGDDE